jgi:A/G-specific adenine glycosylase
MPLPIVEANITRLISRLFDVRHAVDSSAGRKQLWETAAELVPTKRAAEFNSALMDFGALVCRKVPQCSACPVRVFCRAPDPENLPIKKPRPSVKCLTEQHSLTIKSGRLLLQQCTNRWRGMWMLPPFPSEGGSKRDRAIYSSVFPFTNHRITLQVFGGDRGHLAVVREKSELPYSAAAETQQPPRRWFGISQLNTIPIPSPHRRAITELLQLDVES